MSAQRVPVRSLVHCDDNRAEALRAMNGVEVVVGDLTRGPDVIAALDGCRRLYFRMSVSPDFLEAAATVAAAALESRQQRLHWLAEQV